VSRRQQLLLETFALTGGLPVAAMRSAKWFETAAAAQSQDLQFWWLEQQRLQAARQPVNQLWQEELLEKSLCPALAAEERHLKIACSQAAPAQSQSWRRRRQSRNCPAIEPNGQKVTFS
jgi:hypothetical protein